MANVIKRAYQEFVHSDAAQLNVVSADEKLQDMLKNKKSEMVGGFLSKEIMQHAVLKTLQENEPSIQSWLQSKTKDDLHIQKDFLTKIGEGLIKGTDISKKYSFYICSLTLSKKQNLVSDFKITKACPKPNQAIDHLIKKDKRAFYKSRQSNRFTKKRK